MKSILYVAGLFLLAFTACSNPAELSPADESDQEAQDLLTKRGNTDTEPRARYTFFDVLDDGVTPARITGDHRDALGNPVLDGANYSVYEGDLCGVRGKIFSTGSGDAIMDPDYVSSKSQACGEPRFLQFSDGTGVFENGSFMNVGDLYGVRDPQVSERFNIGTKGILGCSTLRFINSSIGSNDAVKYVERLASDGSSKNPREWEVSSVAPHNAICLISKKGRLEPNPTSPTVYAPFRLLVEEIPFVQP